MSEANAISFGKYKGKSITEAARDKKYVEWITSQPWFQVSVLLNAELERIRISESLSTVATDHPQIDSRSMVNATP